MTGDDRLTMKISTPDGDEIDPGEGMRSLSTLQQAWQGEIAGGPPRQCRPKSSETN